ncbi:MAG: MFS transporter [Paracoccaceae bacterium]
MTTRQSVRNQAALLTAAYYAVLFMVLGAHLPYWPVWLAEWGLTEAEIGELLGWTTLARIVGSTVLPALADRFAIRRGMVAMTALAAACVSAVLLAGVETYAGLMAVCLAGALAIAPPVPLGEALGVRASEQFQFSYPVIRAAGSAGFLAANLGVGAVIGQWGPDIVLWIGLIGFVAVAILGLIHPGGGAEASTGMGRTNAADIRALLSSPVFPLLGVTAALGQGAHAVYYAFSVLDWQTRGISAVTTGQLWAFSVLVETVFMLTVGRAWVARLGPAKALGLAALAGVLRWAAMVSGPTGLALWGLQGLHALTFALGHLAAIAFVAAAIPAQLVATAQGVVSGVLAGGIHACALFVAGSVIAWGGVEAGYAMSSAMAAASAGLALVLMSVWQGQRLMEPGET